MHCLTFLFIPKVSMRIMMHCWTLSCLILPYYTLLYCFLLKVMAEITEEELLELKNAFDVYSKGSAEGMVDLHGLGKLFLSLGQKLSEEELKKMLTDLGK